MSDAMAFVTVDAGRSPDSGALRGLAAAFCNAGLPVVHVVDTAAAAEVPPSTEAELDLELLEDGGVQTLGPGEMAIALSHGGAFDATPLDAILRAFGVDTVVVGGPTPSPRVSASVYAGELRGYRVLLATDELAVTLGAHLTAA